MQSQGKRAKQQRSRSGCATCRQRRIKCDEAHPQCLRCVKARLKCDYATPTSKVKNTTLIRINGKRADERILLPKHNDIGSLTITRPTATLPGETDMENQYLRYFQKETTSGFQSVWDWSVWNRLMLQGCHQESFIRDAVVAIGALHKSLHTDAKNTEELAQLQKRFAYQVYGRALRRIQNVIDKGSGPRDALIACLLIVCFENHSGDRYQATYHAQHGLRIYNQLGTRSSLVEDEIADAFRNLDITITTVYDGRTVEAHQKLLDEDGPAAASMPLVFANLHEAKRYWHVIMRRCCHFIPTTWAHTNITSLNRPFKAKIHGGTVSTLGTNIHNVSVRVDAQLEAEQSKYYAEVRRWMIAFEPVFRRIRSSTKSSLREYVTVTMLQIQALNAKVTLASVVYLSEMKYDDHLEDFKATIDYCQDIVRIHNAGSPASYFSGLFVLDLGIVAPLFALVMKCRDRVLRFQGLEILKQWHVEGWWDPLLIATIAKCLIHIEEEGMVAGEIPEESRVMLTGKCHRPPERRMLVQCVQRRKEGLRWLERWAEW